MDWIVDYVIWWFIIGFVMGVMYLIAETGRKK
jgi:hypothetical protein